MALPIVEVRGISKLYRLGHIGLTSLRSEIERLWRRERRESADDFWALRDISFDIAAGEVVGIIGRNGAGKSTLLKILSEITEPTTGEVRIRGQVASLLEVGTGFHPELSGRENVYLNGAILGMRREEIRRKFDEIVAFAEVDRFIDTPVKRYSSGMYVRLAFAVAAHLEPEILIVDEVLAVGDHQFQQKCLAKIRSVSAKEGRTVLFVSHNMTAVSSLCERAIILRDGRLAAIGPVAEMTREYLSSHRDDNMFRPLPNQRAGSGQARIENFRLLTEVPVTGGPLRCQFEISQPEGRQIREVEAAMSIMTQDGQPALQLFSADMGERFALNDGTTLVEMSVDSLPLTAGRYRVALWLGMAQSPIDWIFDAMDLSVGPGEMVSGTTVQSRNFPVVARTHWSIRGTADGR